METTTKTPVTDAELTAYCAKIEDRIRQHYADMKYDKLTPPRVYRDPKGKRYVRIVREEKGGRSKSVIVFIERADGTIWKPAGWKGPEFNFSRGNIRDPDPLAWITPDGCCNTR